MTEEPSPNRKGTTQTMQLMRIGPKGEERPVVRVSDSHCIDVSDVVRDFDESFFAAGGPNILEGVVAARVAKGSSSLLDGVRIGAPIARPHQILCIGLNYRDHATETGQAVPTEPIVFNKAPNTIVGPNDPILIPPAATKTDWEVELGVVIGTQCRYLRSEEDALQSIAGFVLVNDVSERAFQLERGGQWVKGKSAESFNPCGPVLVTPDEFDDLSDLEMWLDVNGVRRQAGSTATMLFSVGYIVHYLSQFMVLEPGDLINTGTPPGVGMAMTPPVWLREGDVVTLGMTGLGSQRQPVRLTP